MAGKAKKRNNIFEIGRDFLPDVDFESIEDKYDYLFDDSKMKRFDFTDLGSLIRGLRPESR